MEPFEVQGTINFDYNKEGAELNSMSKIIKIEMENI
jgi:hypothetical protein